MEANMAASVEGWKPSAFRVSSGERHCDPQAARDLCRPCAQIRGRPWRGGKPGDHVGEDLEELNTAVFQIERQNLKELAHYQNALRLLTVIADNRGEPIDSANGSVPLLLWFVLIVGGIITRYPAFFGASNRLAQTLMKATLAALIVLSLLLALALDYPFTRRRSSICRRPCRPTKPQNLRGSLPMKGWALWEQMAWASRFARRVSLSLARQIAVFCCDQGYNEKNN